MWGSAKTKPMLNVAALHEYCPAEFGSVDVNQ